MEEDLENGKALDDYLDIAKRRKFHILIPFILISFVTLIVAMKLPKVYRSIAVILIEEQQIPKNMVQTTITDYADKRIELIKQRVMTAKTIISIIDKYQLHREERSKLTENELSMHFNENVEVTLLDAAMNPLQGHSGGSNSASIAFTIAFTDQNPEIAQKIATELVTLFLEENIQVRTQRAKRTTEFLTEEAEKLKREIEKIDNNIAEYKQKYGESLPDMIPINLSIIDRTANDLQRTEGQINILMDRIAYLTAALTKYKSEDIKSTDERNHLTKEEQIRVLKAEYRDLSSRYTPSHPSVQRIKRQIQALNPTFDGAISTEDAHTELEKVRLKLRMFKEKYAENHPDIVKLKQKMAALEEQLRTSKNEGNAGSETETNTNAAAKSSDPEYSSLQLQLKSSETELESLTKLREQLKNRIEELRQYMARTPQVERGYFELSRERESNLKKYSDLKAKAMEAKLAQTLEEEQKAENFTLIEPPALPTKPEKGNRKKVIIFGLFVAMCSGIGLAFIAETINGSVRGINALKQITGAYPLVAIPYIENKDDMDARHRNIKLIWLSVALLLALTTITAFTVRFLYPDNSDLSGLMWHPEKSSD